MVVPEASEHPAAEWARQQHFTPQHCDCTTAVVLKILDGKCKMGEEEKGAVTAIYTVTREQPGALFQQDTHQLILRALAGDHEVAGAIHTLRLEAEANIPKPTMKGYKALLRNALFST